jgi:hypothetical protein
VIKRLSVLIYLPTLTPASSTGFVGSSIKTVFSTNASTSYHLFGELWNSEKDGVDW